MHTNNELFLIIKHLILTIYMLLIKIWILKKCTTCLNNKPEHFSQDVWNLFRKPTEIQNYYLIDFCLQQPKVISDGPASLINTDSSITKRTVLYIPLLFFYLDLQSTFHMLAVFYLTYDSI